MDLGTSERFESNTEHISLFLDMNLKAMPSVIDKQTIIIPHGKKKINCLQEQIVMLIVRAINNCSYSFIGRDQNPNNNMLVMVRKISE